MKNVEKQTNKTAILVDFCHIFIALTPYIWYVGTCSKFISRGVGNHPYIIVDHIEEIDTLVGRGLPFCAIKRGVVYQLMPCLFDSHLCFSLYVYRLLYLIFVYC